MRVGLPPGRSLTDICPLVHHTRSSCSTIGALAAASKAVETERFSPQLVKPACVTIRVNGRRGHRAGWWKTEHEYAITAPRLSPRAAASCFSMLPKRSIVELSIVRRVSTLRSFHTTKETQYYYYRCKDARKPLSLCFAVGLPLTSILPPPPQTGVVHLSGLISGRAKFAKEKMARVRGKTDVRTWSPTSSKLEQCFANMRRRMS